jgi:hypothetical protein
MLASVAVVKTVRCLEMNQPFEQKSSAPSVVVLVVGHPSAVVPEIGVAKAPKEVAAKPDYTQSVWVADLESQCNLVVETADHC